MIGELKMWNGIWNIRSEKLNSFVFEICRYSKLHIRYNSLMSGRYHIWQPYPSGATYWNFKCIYMLPLSMTISFPFTTKDSSNNTQKSWLLNLREVENICHSVPNVANITTNDSSSRLKEHIFTYLQYSSSFSNMPPYFNEKCFVYYVTILFYDKTLLLRVWNMFRYNTCSHTRFQLFQFKLAIRKYMNIFSSWDFKCGIWGYDVM